MIRRLVVLVFSLGACAVIIFFVPPAHEAIIWIGLVLAAVCAASLVGLLGNYRYSLYAGMITLFLLYIRWQRIMSLELLIYGLGGLLVSELLFFLLRQLW